MSLLLHIMSTLASSFFAFAVGSPFASACPSVCRYFALAVGAALLIVTTIIYYLVCVLLEVSYQLPFLRGCLHWRGPFAAALT